MTDDTLQKKVSCTACGKQVNQFQSNSVYEHPVLKVLICKVGKLKYIHFTYFHCHYTNIFQSFHSWHIGDHITSSFSSHATSITQVMTSTETLMGWMSSAGTIFHTRPTKHKGSFIKLKWHKDTQKLKDMNSKIIGLAGHLGRTWLWFNHDGFCMTWHSHNSLFFGFVVVVWMRHAANDFNTPLRATINEELEYIFHSSLLSNQSFIYFLFLDI